MTQDCKLIALNWQQILRMSFELIAALATFAFVTSITPGPNNLMLMASGANFGFRGTVPHMLGVGIGFVVMLICVGAGLAQVIEALPPAYTGLKIVSIVYLLYLAWRTANAAPIGTGKTGRRPLSFLAAAAFQWVNPKAWTMALTATTAYAPTHDMSAVVWVAIVFGAINLPSVSAWTLLGRQLAGLLGSPARLKTFNWIMAALLVLSLYPTLFPT